MLIFRGTRVQPCEELPSKITSENSVLVRRGELMLNLVEFDRYMWREDRRPWRVAQPVNHLYQHFVSWGRVSFENSPLTFFCGSGAGGSTEAETESTIVFYFLLKGMLTCLWNNICRFIIHRKCFRAEWYAKSHLLRTSPNLSVLSVCGSIASASVCSVRPSVCLFVWLSVCLNFTSV